MGRVVVAFELAEDGRTKKIRVLEMPHPLLATWAIEAVSQAGKKKRWGKDAGANPLAMPGDVYVTTFVFYWRWAAEEEEEYEEYEECDEDDEDEACEEYEEDS